MRILTGTGGGWGDPLERDPEFVAADVWNGFVTIDEARDAYGVIVDPVTLRVAELTEGVVPRGMPGREG